MSVGHPGKPPPPNDRRNRSSRRQILVPLLAAFLGAAIGVAGGLVVADRQIEESQRQVAQQIEESQRQVAQQITADRIGRTSDVRADTYGQFVSAVDRHLSTVGDVSERPIRDTDEAVFAALRLVQLRGSSDAYSKAQAIAGRARALTNASIRRLQTGRRDLVPNDPFFAQQQALDRFVDLVRPELRG